MHADVRRSLGKPSLVGESLPSLKILQIVGAPHRRPLKIDLEGLPGLHDGFLRSTGCVWLSCRRVRHRLAKTGVMSIIQGRRESVATPIVATASREIVVQLA
jgi:hypothetical protein